MELPEATRRAEVARQTEVTRQDRVELQDLREFQDQQVVAHDLQDPLPDLHQEETRNRNIPAEAG